MAPDDDWLDERLDGWLDEWLEEPTGEGDPAMFDPFELIQPIEPSRTVDRFRRTTAGMMLAGGLMGLAEVIEPLRKEEAPIVVEAPGEPPGPHRFDIDLDPDDPAASTVVFRPWA